MKYLTLSRINKADDNGWVVGAGGRGRWTLLVFQRMGVKYNQGITKFCLGKAFLLFHICRIRSGPRRKS